MKFLNHNLFTGDITVNGTTTLSTATGVTRATGDNSTHLATTAFVKAQGYATTAALAGYVPTSRTLTINGTTYDLSANRSWTISSADGYISNVQVVGSTLSFTGVGSAFSGIVDLSTLTPTVRTVFETVKNVSGATILKGTPLAVVAGQTSGNVSDVVPANAADPTKMPAIFIANENILDQAEGEAVLFGNLTGVDTSAYTSGTTVYVAPGGGWTATKPVHPNLIQNLGVITKQHATNGAGIVTGVGRANALPNLTAGKIWVGSASYPIESTTLHVDEANGRVGIGTTLPSAKVDIEGSVETRYLEVNAIAGFAGIGSTSSAMVEFLNAGDGNTLFIKTNNSARTDAAPLAVWAQTNPRFIVRNDGRVGINTSNPASTLHVVGSRILVQDGSNAGLMLNTGGTNRYSVASTSGAFQIYDEVNLTNRLYITSDGLIGLGTITPTALLDVNGSIRVTGRTTPTTGNGLEIFYYSPSDAFYLEAYNYSTLTYKAIRYSGASHQFITGNVGINTTNPTEKLHVDGRARITTIDNGTGDFATISGTGVITRRTAAQVLSDIGAQPSGSYLTAEADTLQSVTSRGSSTTTVLSTNGGNLVLRADSIENHVTNGNAAIVFNYYGYATGFTQFRDTVFYNGKGSAVMFVDGSSSNVGIGTTNPSYKLDVTGTARINSGSSNLVAYMRSTSSFGAGISFQDATTTASDWIHCGAYGDSFYIAAGFMARLFVDGEGHTKPNSDKLQDLGLDVNRWRTVYTDTVNAAGVITATGGNSTNWNTAYGWGNHASAGYATTSYVTTAIANLVDAAPATLDTLNELAAALGDDPNFATTVTNNIATKVSKSGDTMTGNLSFGSSTRQMINLWSTGYGIGVQSSTTYFRSDSRFSWHRGGSHNDGENNPGGGTVAMTLDSSSNLIVTGTISASGYNKTNWDTAFGWGNHAEAGYWNTDLADPKTVQSTDVIFTGNVTVEGTFTESSSIRFKENITPLDPALDKINQLEAVSYNKIGVDDREIGLIAEDVAELFPEVVTYNEEGQTQGLNYSRLSVILLKAMQEQNAVIAALTERVNKLENK